MSPIQKSADTDYDAWAEKIKGDHRHFGRPEDVKYGAWTRGKCDDETEFSWLAKPDDRDESGTPSPELWNPVRNNPRAATIDKYRREILDLARDMPEAGYELSLRDMVEVPRMVDSKLEGKEKKKKKGMRRSGSMDSGGHLLKMFVPRMSVGFGGRRRSFGKVSPTRPTPVKRREGEWWSKEFGEMVSSTSSSSSSGSSNSSRSSRIFSSCYPFLGHKGKSMGTEE